MQRLSWVYKTVKGFEIVSTYPGMECFGGLNHSLEIFFGFP